MISKTQLHKQVNIIRSIEGAFYKSLRVAQSLIDNSGWGYDDIRISLFGKNSGILNSAVVSLYFLQNHLTHRKWWEVTYGKDFHIFEPAVPDTIKCFDGQAKAALFLGLISNVESSYRIIVRALDPNACAKGKSAFANIYDYLLNRLKLSSDKNIYDMLRHVRNTQLHSDGIFTPHNDRDVQIGCREKVYHFDVGKSFNSASWKLAANLADDLLDSMLRVVKSADVSNFKKIRDPKKNKAIIAS